MPVVFRGSAIVAGFVLLALSGCGQNGPLYMPVVPPLPAALAPATAPASNGATRVSPDASSNPAASTDAPGAAAVPQAASSSK